MSTKNKTTGRIAHDVVREEHNAPSRRHPLGAQRCHAIVYDEHGRARQCKKNARPNFPVCGSHGAGYAKRERDGRAENPALAPLKSGRRATPNTIAQLRAAHPQLAALYDENLADEALFDMRPVLAQAKALASFLVDRVSTNDTADPDDAFRAIQALTQVTKVAGDLLRIERDLGPVTHAELTRFTHGVSELIRRFVPEGQRPQAIAFLREQVGAGR